MTDRDKLNQINVLMEKADMCNCNWEPACQECLEAWIKVKGLSNRSNDMGKEKKLNKNGLGAKNVQLNGN
jgi:hypothetical protein